MSNKGIFRKFSFVALASAFAVLSITAQPPNKGNDKPSQDPNDKVRNVKPELKEAYKKWINQDVLYIITKEEKRAFNALVTDEERENFIENFWRRRDPNPDTEENEYREEYYERIAYANEHFSSGIPGWRTDRGRVYIAWGKPDSIESHPSGGAYDRPPWEGGLVWKKTDTGVDFCGVSCEGDGAQIWLPIKMWLQDEPDSADQKRIKVTSRLNDLLGARYFFTSSDPDIQKITLNWESNFLQSALGEPLTSEGIGNRELRLYGLNDGCFVRFITESITITEYGEFSSDYDPFVGMQDARPGSIEFLSAVRRSDGASYVYHALVRDGRLSVPE